MAKRMLTRIVLAASAASMLATAAEAKSYYLKAERFEMVIDGETIAMWGYAQCTAPDVNTCGAPSVPGPDLWAYDDQNMDIYVYNDLTFANTSSVSHDGGATSILIPGLPLWNVGSVVNSGPVFWGSERNAPGDAAQPPRVRSMAHESVNGAGWTRYLWHKLANPQSGTYIYHSGTHPALQVQMGLYGPMTIRARASSEAYPGVPVDADVGLFYSEIDANFHADVDAGLSGYDPDGDPAVVRTSPIDYHPTHYLLNGAPTTSVPFSPTLDDPLGQTILGGAYSDTTLVRFRSAALTTHVPVAANGATLELIAETARPYPTPRRQSSVLLPALTTADAILSDGREGANVLIDRALGYKNSGGGTATIVLPDTLSIPKTSCVTSGPATGRLILRVRTDTTYGSDQNIVARISNGNPVDDVVFDPLPYHTLLGSGLHQFWRLLPLGQSGPFCGSGTSVTVTSVSRSGGSTSRTDLIP